MPTKVTHLRQRHPNRRPSACPESSATVRVWTRKSVVEFLKAAGVRDAESVVEDCIRGERPAAS